MPLENGVNWRPIDPLARGKHASFSSAIDAVSKSFVIETDVFFDSLVDNWATIFPDIKAKPGRKEGNKLFLYVRSAPILFMLRPKLPLIKRTLLKLANAPSRLEVILEIHK